MCDRLDWVTSGASVGDRQMSGQRIQEDISGNAALPLLPRAHAELSGNSTAQPLSAGNGLRHLLAAAILGLMVYRFMALRMLGVQG